MRVFYANNGSSEYTGKVRDAKAIEYNSWNIKSDYFAEDSIPLSHLLSFRVPLNREYTKSVHKISTYGEQ